MMNIRANYERFYVYLINEKVVGCVGLDIRII